MSEWLRKWSAESRTRVQFSLPAPLILMRGIWKMLKVYNDLTQKKEKFIPLEKNIVKMYICGPTVYDDCHIGHARSFIVFDVMRRYLEYSDFKVIYITNFTDIDDKMINRAIKENITIFELAEKFINSYFEDCDKLNIKRATVYPRATELIDEMIKIIKVLITKKHAYISDGDVYFDISSFPNYAKLSNVNLEETRDSEVDPKKKNQHDFALWKAKKDDEPSWASPWGDGRPGWHIECSAMSQKYLGDTIDIHAGGQDLAFPHHFRLDSISYIQKVPLFLFDPIFVPKYHNYSYFTSPPQ